MSSDNGTAAIAGGAEFVATVFGGAVAGLADLFGGLDDATPAPVWTVCVPVLRIDNQIATATPMITQIDTIRIGVQNEG